jgi:hypothetical protein
MISAGSRLKQQTHGVHHTDEEVEFVRAAVNSPQATSDLAAVKKKTKPEAIANSHPGSCLEKVWRDRPHGVETQAFCNHTATKPVRGTTAGKPQGSTALFVCTTGTSDTFS